MMPVFLVIATIAMQVDGSLLVKGQRSDFVIEADSKATFSLVDSGLWRYSELTKSYQPVLQVEIVNDSPARIRRVRIGGELRGEKATERFEFTSELEISARSSRRYEYRFDKQALDRLGDVETFAPAILSIEREEVFEARVVSGLVMLSADCAADYAKLSKLSGVALRAATADFIKFGCGEVATFSEATPVDGPRIAGMQYFSIEGPYGQSFNAWVKPHQLTTQTRKRFVKQQVTAK